MSRLWYKLSEWTLARYVASVGSDRNDAWKLAAILHFERRWAQARGLDFDYALEVSDVDGQAQLAENLAKHP